MTTTAAQGRWHPGRWLPSEPLLRQVAARGGPRACGIEQDSSWLELYRRAKRNGCLTIEAADRISVVILGEHPAMIWGDAWWLPD